MTYAEYGVATIHFFTLEEPYKRDDILQKRPIILRSLLIVLKLFEMLCLMCEFDFLSSCLV